MALSLLQDPARPPVSPSFRPGPLGRGELVADTYRVIRQVGTGGFATVYEGFDEVLRRPVALKVSSEELAGLLDEARALAALQHPGIVAVYGFGTHRGYEYVALELLKGKSLRELLNAKLMAGAQMPVSECISLALSVAEVLIVLHAHGLLHRDIKPDNIMLAPGDRVVLMDFGLTVPRGSRPALMDGTPEYMAPETVVGTELCTSVDIYGLGATLWELLTGNPVYTNRGKPVPVTMHVIGTPVPLRSLRPIVPHRLAELVHEMLSKEPADRPDAVEVAHRLRLCRESLRKKCRPAGFRVMVVDDDLAINRLLKTWVAKHLPHATVESADNAEDALVRISVEAPDVLLLDLNMPRTSGVELAMMLRGSGLARDCRIVSVSAAAQPADEDLLRSLGVTHIVRKGATMLHEVLAHVLDQWENVQKLNRA